MVDLPEDELDSKTPNEEEIAAEPFDESSLLEMAKTEGLVDGLSEETQVDAEEDKSAAAELSDADKQHISASMETILFMSDRPVSLPKLRSVINPGVSLGVYRSLMAELRGEFAKDSRGIEIAEVSLGFQLRTKPHMSSVLRKMVKTQPLKLSTTNMEVLAIIAYKQPVTKDELDQIRGVDSGYVLRNLMEKRLVRIAGRSDLPGKPMVYGTTHEFLELFNLKDLKQMPPLHEVEQMVASSEVGTEEKMQTVMDEFGKMIAQDKKVLFDDSLIDEELEALRAEIASIPTSTDFIDEQKHREKLEAKLAELATKGLTLDAEGNIVPIGYVAPVTDTPMPTEEASIMTSTIASDSDVVVQMDAAPVTESEYQPSAELEAEAANAQWERHAEMIAQAVEESKLESEVAVVNAESLSEALEEAKAEQQEHAQSHELLDASPENEHN
jgi:segregation and condensation protein B